MIGRLALVAAFFALGMLVAPKSGTENRKEVTRRARAFMAELRRKK